MTNHRGVDAIQKHLRRNKVAGDGQLDKSVAGKHHKPDAVVAELVDELRHNHLGTLHAAQLTVAGLVDGPHRVAHIDGNNSFDAGLLLLADALAKLRTSQHHDKQCEGSLKQPELQAGTPARHQRHQLAHQIGVAKLAQALLLIAVSEKAYQGQQYYDCQQVKILWVFKSEHYGILLKMVILSRISSSKAMMAASTRF